MITHIQPSRLHRVLGARMVNGKWNAQVKHQPLALVMAPLPRVSLAIYRLDWLLRLTGI